MRISVAMATYNGSKFIIPQLESLAQQTLLPEELVICDDGSTDETVKLINSFRKNAPFPIFYHANPSRRGYRLNFMECCRRCSGDLIAFCDQDDIWLRDKLLVQSTAFKDKSVLLSTHNVDLVNQDGSVLGPYRPTFKPRSRMSFESAGPWSFMPGFTQMFRGTLIESLQCWPLSKDLYEPGYPMAHDLWFFLLALLLGEVSFSREVLALYRQHETNASGRKSAKRIILGRVKHERVRQYKRLLDDAVGRKPVLLSLANVDRPKRERERLLRGAEVYEQVALRTERRLSTYRSNTEREAFRCILKGVLAGDYGLGDPFKFSVFGLARDMLVNVLGV